MRGILPDWEVELARWLKPFLGQLGTRRGGECARIQSPQMGRIHRPLRQRRCRLMTGAPPPTGRKTTSAAQRSRAEQHQMADYYARLTQEQEERQNAEARERFAGR